MILVVSASGVTVEQAHDFKRFAMAVAGGLEGAELQHALGRLATLAEEDHAWVSETALRSMPGLRDDEAWQKGLDGMIAYARRHGWVDDTTQAIRAHIERRD
ncbi:MAG: hypothetical protein JO264_11095 [Acidisphaera sp.]|nr:hypothetical protein [Acidisphaera sp.]